MSDQFTITLLYCRACDWQEKSTNIPDIWDSRTCPGCGDIGISYVRYQPYERAHASFVAKRQIDPVTETPVTDEFLGDIWWVQDGTGHVRNATPKECAAEIKRLRAELTEAPTDAKAMNDVYYGLLLT